MSIPSDNLQSASSLTLDQARRVPWVQGKGPIGELLNSGTIGRKDLEWASEKAYIPDLRAAARVLLQHLDQPAPADGERPRYGPRVVVGSGYLEEQQEVAWFKVGMLAGFGLMGIPLYGLRLMRAILKRKTVEALIVQPTGALYYGMIWRYLKREMKAYRSFQSGRRGEERMLEQIRCYLDQRWTIFRNLQLPGRKSDIDLVLVGPGGVWVVEIKAYAGTIRVRDGAWERQQGGAWRPLDGDPEKQVRGNAAALNDFLQRHGINRWVESAVALAEPQPISNLEGAALPIWADFNVASQVAALATRNPPSREEQAAIVALLTRQAEQQVAVEESRQKPE